MAEKWINIKTENLASSVKTIEILKDCTEFNETIKVKTIKADAKSWRDQNIEKLKLAEL